MCTVLLWGCFGSCYGSRAEAVAMLLSRQACMNTSPAIRLSPFIGNRPLLQSDAPGIPFSGGPYSY